MEKVKCSHCEGSGKERASMSLDTGQINYRTCSVCEGTGSVAAERSHFTQYPDLSLQKAHELMRKHGKPVEICIAGNHDIRISFEDGARYILGGFTVGYRGTGPDYCKAFLNAAGFSVSIDEIAEMRPPVTLVAGQPYIASKTLVFEASTVEEAKKVAGESVPLGAKVIALEVIRDGTPKTIEDEGSSEDIALENAKSRLPEGAIVEQKRVSDGIAKTVEGMGNSEDIALEDAKRHLPEGAIIEQKKVVQVGSEGTLTVPAFSEPDAKTSAQKQLPAGAVIQRIVCSQPMSKGFLGFGRKSGSYEVSWALPWKMHLTYHLRKVVLTYRQTAAVRVRFQPPSK